MAVTPVQSAPYPALTDPPNGPAQIQALGVWTETRIVMRFANATARDNALSTAGVSPVAGMIAWLDDRNAYSHYGNSTWSVLTVGSEIGRSKVGGSTATSGSFVQVTTGVKVTISIPARRSLSIHYSLNGHSETGSNHANSIRAYLTRRTGSGDPAVGDTKIHQAHANLGDSGIDASCGDTWPDTLDPGTYTYGLLFEARGGTGHKDDLAGLVPAYVVVYDAGPA